MRFYAVLFSLLGIALLVRSQNPPCASLLPMTITELDGVIKNDIIWSEDKQIAFFSTTFSNNRNGTLWRSTDGGLTWSNENPKLSGADAVWNLDGRGPAGGVYAIHRAATPNVFYFEGWGPRMWVTQDFGVTYSQVYIGEQYAIEAVYPHPRREDLFLGVLSSSCCYQPCSDYCSADLVLFTGYGLLAGTTVRKYVSTRPDITISWGKAGYDGYSDNSLYAIYAPVSGQDQYNVPDDDYVLEFISDALEPNSQSYQVDSVFGFVFINETNTIVAGQYTNFGARLVTSSDNLATVTAIDFPNAPGVNSIAESGYSFLDVEKGTLFIGVLGYASGGQRTDLYGSDQFSDNFRLILEHIVWDDDVEFGKVSGIDGLYIANRYQNGGKQSLLTFNQGGSWSPLRVNGSCDGCTLNLYSPSSDVKDHFYSRPTAPGIIIATGNAGISLNQEQSAANTYFTRDAGLTWRMLAPGSHLVAFSNFGSLLLMVDDMDAIDSVQFSVDQGSSFDTCSLVEAGNDTASVNLQALRIYTEPTTTQTHFMLLTSFTDVNGADKFMLFGLNFTGYFTRKCIGEDAPGTAQSDYEYFNPTGVQDSCILGVDVTYVRRKAGVACYVPMTEQVVTQTRICNCTMDDYVCSPCYKWSEVSQSCELYCTVSPYIPADCSGTYVPVTYGYQKNAASQCQGGLNMLPGPNATPLDCPLTSVPSGFTDPDGLTGDRSAGEIIAIVFIVVGGVIFLVGVALATVYFIRRKRRLAAGAAAPTIDAKPKVSSTQEGVHNPYAVQLDESSM
eukprot:TRINITY_DN2198_c0_g1_i1.p1 TRINITY_DN2198_c0_g1~~TRINITY_DN2198_c0_g1_i1.p1  ORF type:complete len:785 (-),score=200.26 TRINITY_DN2198_c0_g1_i1:15-2369(-)